jgi:hypothetical protein
MAKAKLALPEPPIRVTGGCSEEGIINASVTAYRRYYAEVSCSLKPIAGLVVAGALAALSAACASAPARLEPQVAGAIRSTEIHSLVLAPTLSVDVAPQAPFTGGLLAYLITSQLAATATNRLEPLRAATTDLHFAAEYAAGLAKAVQGETWLHVTKVMGAEGEPPPAWRAATSNSILRVETKESFSPDSTVFHIRSVLEFFPSIEARQPSARVVTFYRSDPVGDVADEMAVARWTDDRGKLFRAARAQGLAESLKLARLAVDSMANASSAGSRSEKKLEDIWVSLAWGRPGFGRKLNAQALVGTVIEEHEDRIIVEAEGAFFSLATSGIESRKPHEDHPEAEP